MNNTEQYYTPIDSDFYLGYTYEIYEDFDVQPEKTWHKMVYGENGTHNPENLTYPFPIKESKIRTKYLDKQDLESLGWEVDIQRAFFEVFKNNEELQVANKLIKDKVYNLIYHKPNKWLTIKMKNLEGQHKENEPIHTIYYGKCPSINELKKIMSYLGIR